MFNNIARTYDLLNHVLSFGIDYYWRYRAIRLLRPSQPGLILDMATGTGDFALETLRQLPSSRIVGMDLSETMLAVGQTKLRKRQVTDRIHFACADAENLPIPDAIFDAVTVAFGVRNFETLSTGLREMGRVLKPGGQLIILEFSRPVSFPMKQLYFFYFKRVLPLIGRLVSKNQTAYTYLPESVLQFPDPDLLARMLKTAGFQSVRIESMTAGIVTIHHAIR
ncbi:MAG: bifunctional demethylmenaquinone methyltransferase/2-methoxy-6-polyprenyl-1,4-benzoquinol methylase UbiE [Bacteroidetes bacterium]|nr:bifunctional demethylmenaquinone methyltransferase/2-methoxy-6-polyprenyl-1,4-benzoquinol methylase UbiE [Bacteroidota bacterium]